ncbi:MAG: type VI secretion system baseplate subunit TssG [Polyangiaceae bacterium]|nr:type VI secretion system baseplate subunit TssG [Polyangiaceae bacterium]
MARLREAGHTFSFFQAVQLLHRLTPNAVPLGELGPPVKEGIRLHHDSRLIFAAGDVSAIRELADGRIELVATFLGLTGAASPLATAICEEIEQAEEEEAQRLRDFYDIIHHRVLSLMYRAWKKYRFAAGFRTGGADQFTRRAMAFVGTDLWGAVPSRGLPPVILLSLATTFAQRTRSARMLELVLQRMFEGLTVRVESFIPRRVAIPGDQQVSLGVVRTTIGEDFTIGTHVQDRSGRFRVHVGPATFDECSTLMPGGQHYATLRDVVAQFTRGILEAELEVELAAESGVSFQLASRASSTLGVTTRLFSAERGQKTRMRTLLSDSPGDTRAVLVSE